VININWPILHRFRDVAFARSKIAIFDYPLCLTPPAEWFPWDDLRKILCGCQRMAKVSNFVEILPKISTAWIRRTSVTDDRQTDRRATANGEREREFYGWLKRHQSCELHCVRKKTATLFFVHNFGKWTPCFTILSLLDFAGNFLQICYRDLHLTLDVLLYYLAKSEIQYIRVLKNSPFLFSYFFLKRQSFAI